MEQIAVLEGRAERPDLRDIFMEEEDVVARCRKGDLAAYRDLYIRYEQPFLRTALRILGRPQEAEDAVQETFLKLHRGIGHYREGSKFSTYFFRILINTCLDLLRKRRFETGSPLNEDTAGGLPPREIDPALERAIEALPERMKTCFYLFAVEELRLNDIARSLDLSVGAVKANIHHARVKLRRNLTPVEKENAS